MYTLSLHDALPISLGTRAGRRVVGNVLAGRDGIVGTVRVAWLFTRRIGSFSVGVVARIGFVRSGRIRLVPDDAPFRGDVLRRVRPQWTDAVDPAGRRRRAAAGVPPAGAVRAVDALAAGSTYSGQVPLTMRQVVLDTTDV